MRKSVLKIARTLVAASAMLVPGLALAATFQVEASGTVTAIQPGLQGGPYAMGDTMTITFTVTDEAGAPQDRSSPAGGTDLRYFDSILSMTGSVGGYSFASVASPSSDNYVQIRNDRPSGSNVSDALFIRRGVSGPAINGLSATRMDLNVYKTSSNPSDTPYSDSGLTPDKFSQSALSLFDATTFSMSLFFGEIGNQQQIQARLTGLSLVETPAPSEVPLPASALFLISGLGLGAFGRRYAAR